MKDAFQAKQGHEVPSRSNFVSLSSEGCHCIELKISQISTTRELLIIYISRFLPDFYFYFYKYAAGHELLLNLLLQGGRES